MTEQTAEFDPQAAGWLTLDHLVQELRRLKVYLGRGKPERLIHYWQATKVIGPSRLAPARGRRRRMVAWFPPETVSTIEQFRLGREAGGPRIDSPVVKFWTYLSGQFYANCATDTERMDILLFVDRHRRNLLPPDFLRSPQEIDAGLESVRVEFSRGMTPEQQAAFSQTIEQWRAKSKTAQQEFLKFLTDNPATPAEIHRAVVTLFPGEVIVKRGVAFAVLYLLREFAEIQRGLEEGDEGSVYARAANAAEAAPYAERFLVEWINALAAQRNAPAAEPTTEPITHKE